jgi:hypothetical protein
MLKTGGGAIDSTASALGAVAIPNTSEYGTAKHGVVWLTRAAAVDVRPHSIRMTHYRREPSRGQWWSGPLRPQSFRHTLLNCGSGTGPVGSGSPGRSAMQLHYCCQMPPRSSRVRRYLWKEVSLRHLPDSGFESFGVFRLRSNW